MKVYFQKRIIFIFILFLKYFFSFQNTSFILPGSENFSLTLNLSSFLEINFSFFDTQRDLKSYMLEVISKICLIDLQTRLDLSMILVLTELEVVFTHYRWVLSWSATQGSYFNPVLKRSFSFSFIFFSYFLFFSHNPWNSRNTKLNHRDTLLLI